MGICMAYTILIADDEAEIRDILHLYLEQAGFHVVEAADGFETLSLLEKEAPDLLLLDIMMPKIDGYKVLASIRNAERKHGVSRMLRSKVIMTSALDETSFDSNQASDDYDDYICKPIDIMKFNEILKKLDVI